MEGGQEEVSRYLKEPHNRRAIKTTMRTIKQRATRRKSNDTLRVWTRSLDILPAKERKTQP